MPFKHRTGINHPCRVRPFPSTTSKSSAVKSCIGSQLILNTCNGKWDGQYLLYSAPLKRLRGFRHILHSEKKTLFELRAQQSYFEFKMQLWKYNFNFRSPFNFQLDSAWSQSYNLSHLHKLLLSHTCFGCSLVLNIKKCHLYPSNLYLARI